MGAIIIKDKVTQEELQIAKQDHGEYIKIVIDVVAGTMAIGGEWHADAEAILREQGSHKADMWGGGLDMAAGVVEFNSLINTREGNKSQEILDVKIRGLFEKMVREKFNL